MNDFHQLRQSILAGMSILTAGLASVMGVSMLHTKLLIWMILLDYITGLIVAGAFGKSNKTGTGRLSSRASAEGIFRKAGIIMIIIMVNQIESTIQMDYMTNSVFIFFLTSECLSVLENLGLMGVPYPAKLKEALEVLKEEHTGSPNEDTHDNNIQNPPCHL